MAQITLKFSNIVANGKPCVNPIVVITNSQGEVKFPCGDKIDSSGNIKVSIPDTLFSESCVSGYIKCSECDTCPEKEFKACLCNADADCKECEKCIDGVCISLCKDKICNNGTCVDCLNDADCPVGFKCQNGDCVCRGKIDSNGDCVNCLTNKDCGQCENCVNGDCVPLDCPNNTICINGGCGCPPGSKYDVVTDSCIPDDDCTKDSDCKECETCVGGECQPIICPKDYKCVNGDCVYAPCDGKPCDNGLDCEHEDCGCSKVTKTCVSCLEDPTALGCEGDCNTPCNNGLDCPDDCVCYGGECVKCSNFDCEDCASVYGCGCINGDCLPNGDDKDCKDKLKLEIDECNLKATLTKQSSCQCEAISAGVKLTKISVEPLVPTVGVQKIYADFTVDLRKGIQATSEGFGLLPLFSNDVTNNELPTAGQAIIKAFPVYRSIVSNEVIESTTPYEYTESLANKSTVNFTRKLIGELGVQTLRLIGYKYEIVVSGLMFPSKCEYKTTTLYKSTNTETQSSVKLNTYFGVTTMTSESSRNPKFTWFKDDVAIRSFFVDADAPNTYIDDLFGPKRFLTNTDRGVQTLVTPKGELIPNTKYTIKADCNCDTPKVIDKIVICDIKFEKDSHFRVNTTADSTFCNNRVEILDDFKVCPINQDLNYFGWSGADLAKQTKYILSVNGKDVAKFVFKNTSDTQGTLKLEGTNQDYVGYSYVSTEEITRVSLRMNHDGACNKESNIQSELCDPVITGVCNNSGTIDFTVSPTCTPMASVLYKGTTYDVVRSGNGSVTVTGVPSKVDAVFTVIFDNGCRKNFIASKDCCNEDSLIVEGTSPIFEDKTVIRVKTSNNQVITKIFINNSETSFTVDGNSYVVELGSRTTSTNYTVRVITQAGCEYTKVVSVEPSTTSTVTFNPSIICANGVSTLTINSDKPNVNFSVSAPNGNVLTGVTDSNGTGTISNVSIPGIYNLISFDGVAVTGVLVPLGQVPLLQINNFSLVASGPFCTGDDVNFNINATPNTIVTVVSNGITKLISINGVGVGSGEFTYNSPGTYPINATLITTTIGTCPNTQNLSLSAVVSNKPIVSDIITDCVLPLSPTSDIVVKAVTNLSGLTVTAVVAGVTYNMTAISPNNIYQVTVPQGSGKTVQVTATNGTCTTTRTETAQSCACGQVLMPNPPANLISCGGNLVVSFNQEPGMELVWFDMTNGNIELAPPAWSKSLTPGTYEVLHRDTTSGCESQRVQFIVVDGDMTVTLSASTVTPCIGSNLTITSNVIGNNTSGLTYSWYLDNIIQPTTSSSFILSPNTVAPATIKLVVQRGNTSCIAENTIIITPQVCCSPFTITVNTNCMIASVQGASVSDLFDYVWTTTGGTILQTNTGVNTSTFTNPTGLPQGSTVKVKVSKTATCFEEVTTVINPPVLSVTKELDVKYFTYNDASKAIIKGVRVRNCNINANGSWVQIFDPLSSNPQGGTYTAGFITSSYEYKINSGPCTNIPALLSMSDLVNDVNTALSNLGKQATISYNSATREITYSAPESVNEYEQIDFYIAWRDSSQPCSNSSGEWTSGLPNTNFSLDFPCQCP